VGTASIELVGAGSSPTGLAIFGYRQGGTLVSEASVPLARLMRSAIVYAEINGPINTGIAISNPNDADVTVTFNFNDSSLGYYNPVNFKTLTVPAKGQISRFLNELPYGLRGTFTGTLEISATLPVGVIALRAYTNERSEFLVTTLPVIDMSAGGSPNPSFLAHYAVEGGWKTDFVLVNPTTDTAVGNIEFRDPAGQPADLMIGLIPRSSLTYSIPPRNSMTVKLTGPGETPRTGSIRVSLSSGLATPVPLAVFSYRRDNVTVSEAGLSATRARTFRTFVEAGVSVQSGLAITNGGSLPVTVTFDLRRLDGTSAGLTATRIIPGSGQLALFLNELFPSLPEQISGVLRISATEPGDVIGVVGLRTRINERGDFLITTVPPVDESVAASATGTVFPHIADSGGYTTQFVLYGPSGGSALGNLLFLTPGGQPFGLTLR
jgi:hypothetical protein